MNRTQFLNAVAERTDAHKRDVEHIWENALQVIQENIKKGERVNIKGFGAFRQYARKAGWARNPATGERVKVGAKKLPKFTAAKQFKEYVQGKVKLEPVATRPVKLAADDAPAKKTAARKPAAKKAAKKTAKKSPARKPAAKKTAKKAAKKPARRR